MKHRKSMILLVDPAQLLDQIETDVLAEVRSRQPRAGAEGFVIRLLIADDSALMRKLLEAIFSRGRRFRHPARAQRQRGA